MNEKYGILKNKKGIEKTNLLDDLELVVASKARITPSNKNTEAPQVAVTIINHSNYTQYISLSCSTKILDLKKPLDDQSIYSAHVLSCPNLDLLDLPPCSTILLVQGNPLSVGTQVKLVVLHWANTGALDNA